jgi:putative ATP-binding cassette transporter
MIELITASFTITVCMMYLAFLSRLVFFLVILVMTLGTLLYLLRQQSAKTNLEQSRSQMDNTYKLILEFLNGFKELKLNPEKGNDLFNNHIRPGFDHTRKLLVKSSQIVQLNYSLGLGLFFSLLGVVLFFLPHHFSDNITVIPKIAVVILYMVAPGGQFLYSALQFINLRVAIDNLEALKTLAQSEKEEKTAEPHDSDTFYDFSVIRLRNICYSYMDSTGSPLFTAGPMTIDIKRGKLIFITGGNGDGKTTLCKLITGLYFPRQGHIEVDGSLVTPQNIDLYRNLFSAVFSDFYLFERLYGINPVDEKEIDLWLDRFRLTHKLTLNQGVLSSRSLSSGQKRRLALLCALMEKRPVLVCDEMTADQEPEFREYFYKTFISEMKSIGKTIIVITHDDRYFHLADQMVKLNYGVRMDEAVAL